MATDESWGRNLRRAKRAFEERHDTRLTYGEIGRLVAKAMGRGKPFGHSAVLNWIENGQEPEGFPVVRALAEVLEVEVGALLSRPDQLDTAPGATEGGTVERPKWPNVKTPDPLRNELQGRGHNRKKRGA